MKYLFTILLMFFVTGSFAQDLNKMKQEATSRIDSKVNSLNRSRECINNANTLDKFKACKYDMKLDMKKQKMEAKKGNKRI